MNVDHLTNHAIHYLESRCRLTKNQQEKICKFVVAYQVDTLEISLREQLDMVDRCINSRIVCLPEFERAHNLFSYLLTSLKGCSSSKPLSRTRAKQSPYYGNA